MVITVKLPLEAGQCKEHPIHNFQFVYVPDRGAQLHQPINASTITASTHYYHYNSCRWFTELPAKHIAFELHSC